jgi:protein phosphatase-4 regulatory subunit 3
MTCAVDVDADCVPDDPDFPSHRASHRAYLSDTTKFKEVVHFEHTEIRKKIHYTYRLLYLKDVVLARILDDPTFSVLNSLIFFHQVDIVNHIQANQAFLKELFSIFGDDNKDAERKKLAVLFIQNCCTVAKNIQPPSRAALYQNFLAHGLFSVITFSLRHRDAAVRVAGTEVLVCLIDHDAPLVRANIARAINEKTVPLTDTLIDLLLLEMDLGVKSQMADAIKILLDSSPVNAGLTQGTADFVAKQRGEQGHGRPVPNQANQFIQAFYDDGAKRLFQPLKDLEKRQSMVGLTVQETSLYTHLVEVLQFFDSTYTRPRCLYWQRICIRVLRNCWNVPKST